MKMSTRIKLGKKWWLAFVLAFVLILTGCSGDNNEVEPANQATPITAEDQTEKPQEPQEPLTLRLSGSDYGLPSPYLHSPRGPGFYNMYLLFDGLLEKDEKQLIPWLASEWTIENEGKSFLFTIRDDVYWHDGTKLTAEDVKFTYDYFVKHPPIRNTLFEGESPLIESTEIVGDNQVRINVIEANATYLEKIGFAMKIIPKHIWESVTEPKSWNDDQALVGSGPYLLDDYSSEQGSYRFVANPNYWGPKPRVDVIEQIPVSEPLLAFEKGDIDYTELTSDVLTRFEGKDEYAIIQNPPFFGVRLSFNMEKRSELKDKSIRQAFAYAIDQEELVEKVIRGAGIPGSAGYLPQGHPYYNDQVKQYSFDLDKAKELLNGQEYTFEMSIPNMEQTVRSAELIKLSLQKVGIHLNVSTYDTKTNDEMVRQGNYELTLNAFGGWGADPDQLRTIFAAKPRGQGFSETIGYDNPAVNELAAKQMAEMDNKKRHELVNELQQLVAEEVPALTVFNTQSYYVYRPAKFDGWMYMYDHHAAHHSKLTYLTRE